MGKTRKSAEREKSVLRDAKEVTAIEQYRHLADRPKPRKPPKNYKYLDELAHLQFELIKLQESVRLQGLRVIVIFEGRDAAGKGGVIKRITQSLNPRICRVVALGTPTERERGQWYFQRYIAHLPAPGEIVLFDRSWYNRAGVEHVMGFCTVEEYNEFLPIRLMQTPTTCGVRPFAGIERGVGWRLSAARDAKQRSERVKRIEASIEAERELVEIGL